MLSEQINYIFLFLVFTHIWTNSNLDSWLESVAVGYHACAFGLSNQRSIVHQRDFTFQIILQKIAYLNNIVLTIGHIIQYIRTWLMAIIDILIWQPMRPVWVYMEIGQSGECIKYIEESKDIPETILSHTILLIFWKIPFFIKSISHFSRKNPENLFVGFLSIMFSFKQNPQYKIKP